MFNITLFTVYVFLILNIWEIALFKVSAHSLLFKNEIKSKEDVARRALFYIIPGLGVIVVLFFISKAILKIIKEKINWFKHLPPL